MTSEEGKLCVRCGEAARVHVSLVKGGLVESKAYCEAHASEAEILHAHGYGLIEESEAAGTRLGDAAVRCEVCDCSQRDFERQGRFGCPSCYGAFTGILGPMFGRIQRGGEHRGKIPQRRADREVMRHRLARLQAELSDAVRAEHFEWAAQTRDAIAAIKAKLLGEGGAAGQAAARAGETGRRGAAPGG